MRNLLTIDVEDYYHVSAFEAVVRYEDWGHHESRVERNTHRLLDLLDQHQTQATFFVLGWVAERQRSLVRAIAARGHEVASHGYAHRRIYTQTAERFRAETRRSKGLLEDAIGRPILGYRAASYSITAHSLWALDILIQEGFLYDSSIFPIWHDLYGIPGAPRFPHMIHRSAGSIMEYPPSTIRLGNLDLPVGGGGYLRLFPYALTRWAISRLNRVEQQPAMVYLHPWEVDPQQPRLPGTWLSRFRHYVNLHKTIGRLEALLNDFRFGRLQDLHTEKHEHADF